MSAEKMHKHLEPDLGPSPAVIPSSSTGCRGNEMQLPGPPTQGREAVHRAGWACWLSLTVGVIY